METATCGVLTVPENRTDDNGRTIQLPVFRVPAMSPDPAPDPVLFVNGGPGSSTILGSSFLLENEMNRDRDLIFIAGRGSWGATPDLNCPEIEDYEEALLDSVYDAPATQEAGVKAARRCRERIVAENEGIDLGAYNTTEAVHDYADLRTALGIEEWNVLGHSYGTDLVLQMMRERPEGIRTVTLDGLVPPDIASVTAWTWSSLKSSVDNVFAACAQQPECAARYPNLPELLNQLVNRLEAEPVRTTVEMEDGTSVDVVLDGGALMNSLLTFAHQPADIPSALDELNRGNPEKIAQIWASKWAPLPPSARGGFTHGYGFSVICSEWVPFNTQEEELAEARTYFPEFPDSVLSLGPQLPYFYEKCEVWDVPKADESVREPTTSSLRTLLMGGTFDAQTGIQWQDHVAETLDNSVSVKFPGYSHGPFFQVRPCAQEVLLSFWDDPAAPDTSCVASVTVRPFTIGPPT
jgi:pimeloyl-ACP methyl ester carboxylesterase